MKKPLSTLVLAVTLALLASACNGGHDWYGDVFEACNYKHAPGTLIAAAAIPDLHPDCKAALEAILPYDSSWSKAPAYLKDKVTEAFQAVIPYELAWPSENRILGVAPYSIPLWHVDLIDSDTPRQRAIFNHLIDVIGTITYGGSSDTASAALTPYASLSGEQLTIYDQFTSYDNLSGWNYTNPFLRTTILIHEAHHGDGVTHEPCPDGSIECDPQLDGPYGLEVTYLELLLHGSGNKGADGSPSPLSDVDLANLGTMLCLQFSSIKTDYLKPDLKALVSSLDCYDITPDWLIKQEGLSR